MCLERHVKFVYNMNAILSFLMIVFMAEQNQENYLATVTAEEFSVHKVAVYFMYFGVLCSYVKIEIPNNIYK